MLLEKEIVNRPRIRLIIIIYPNFSTSTLFGKDMRNLNQRSDLNEDGTWVHSVESSEISPKLQRW